MAFLFSPGGPQVGAVRVLALLAGVASAVPGVANAAAISIVPVQAPLAQFPGRIAAVAIGNPAITDAMMGAGGPAGVTACGRGWAQRDLGRFSA